MKIRQGFVSNSSSSSFLLAIAKIENKGKVFEIIDNPDNDIYGLNAVIRKYDSSFDPFTGDIFFTPNCKDLKNGDDILVIEFYGDEGDSHFYDGDGELDYDFEFYDLDIEIHNLIESLNPYITNFDYIVGAQRIG